MLQDEYIMKGDHMCAAAIENDFSCASLPTITKNGMKGKDRKAFEEMETRRKIGCRVGKNNKVLFQKSFK